MKVRDTSQGRMYAISSEIGCTAINGAMAVDIPVGGQSVILALDKKIVIDGDDTAKFVEVRWGTNTAVGSRPVPAWLSDVLAGLISIVGDDNFDINYVPAENKVYLVFSLDTTVSQVAEVENLLDRVLPSNVVTELEWADGLPIEYVRVDYLESTNTQYICAENISIDTNDSYSYKSQLVHADYTDGIWGTTSNELRSYTFTGNNLYGISFGAATNYKLNLIRDGYQPLKIELNKDELLVNGVQYTSTVNIEYIKADKLYLFTQFVNDRYWPGEVRFYYFTVKGKHNFVPALNPSGIPGMYDTVSREFKTNAGTGQFAIGLTLQQVKDLRLPAPGDVNTLLLSLSYDVYNDTEAWNVIENARSLGWKFTFLWSNITEYLTPRINAIVGAGNYTINYDYVAGKLSLAFAEEVVTNAQIAEVSSLLARILPSDIVVEIAEMPMGYSRLEYIENPSNAFINLDRSLGWDYELAAEYFVVRTPDPEKGGFCALIGHTAEPRQCVYSCRNANGVRYDYNNSVLGSNVFTAECRFHVNVDKNVAVFNNLTTNETNTITLPAGEFEQPAKVFVFAAAGPTGTMHYPAWIRLYYLKGSRGGVPQFDLIPAFDEGSQGPCLFDKVSRKVYRSANPEVDFTYPGAPTQATTYSLRRPTMYAQYTERGIRRLYGMPYPEGYDDTMEEGVLEGYDSTMEGVTEDCNSTITLEEYAAANGFKELVVPPMPEEGHWLPEWSETDTQLICEWVETDAPAEVLQIEEIENA